MDTRGENSPSYQVHPVDISCANPGSSDPKPGFEETFTGMGPKGMNGGFLMDHVEVWSSVPCTDLLALANAATTTRGSAAAAAGSDINRRLENQDRSFGSGFHQEDSSTPYPQQYVRPNGSTYLFDLNSPPTTEAEPPPVTPEQAKRAEAIPDVVNKGETTNLVAKKNDNKSFNLAIESSQGAVESTEADTDWDFNDGSSGDETHLIKTPLQQPKQRRRKHRPKVVIEGKPKSAKKPKAPKPTEKRKYIKKIGIDKLTSTPAAAAETSPVWQTRNSSRRKINFDEERNLTFDRAFSTNHVVENYPTTLGTHQFLSPVTPNKTERPMKDAAKPICSRPKSGMNFSQETHNKWGEARGEKRERSSKIDGIELGDKNATEIHFPAIYKKKRTEKCRKPSTLSSVWSARSLDVFRAPETSTGYYGVKGMLVLGVAEGCRKKRTKGLTRPRDLASFAGMMQGKQWPVQKHTCIEALVADFGVDIPTKKRTKRNSIVPSSLYHNHQFLTNHIGLRPGLRWRSIYDIDALITQFERLDINTQMHALTPYSTRFQEKNALVLYQQHTSLVPYNGLYNPLRRRKPRPKVDLDDETTRVWRLLLEDINSEGIDGTDEEKAKWWEEERSVFSGRAASFIARMHLVQGDRRFSQWKGSVVDSVIGVYLTQNVSDHLSSSAFMSLAARYPLKSTSINEQLQEDISSISINEPCQVDLNETISPRNSVDTSLNSVQSSIVQTSERQGSFSMSNFGAELTGGSKATTVTVIGEYFDPGEESKAVNERCKERCASEQSEASAESASQVTVQMSKETSKSKVKEIFGCETTSESPKIRSIQHTRENNSVEHKVIDSENIVTGISEITGSNSIVETSRETARMVVESNSNDHNDLQAIVDYIDEGSSKAKQGKKGKAKQIKPDWDSLRRVAQVKSKRERTPNTMDSLDYEAVRCADVHEIADTIKERGMNNMLAERIKDFLNRLTRDHGSIDLEWLRDVPPDKAKEYLLSFRGLGLKSVECVRLLTLHHLAFPVDTNVGRIAVRLGWVPLQPLPESLQLHLLELYPVLESIQKYLWPRLCKLDQRTLYELHYQMITFGKVFCTKNKPNCNACPMRGECRHFASAFASARLALPAAQEKGMVVSTENRAPGQSPTERNPQHLTLPPANEQLTLPPANQQLQQLSEAGNCDPVIEEPATPEPMVEVPETPEAEQIQQEFDMEDFYEDPEEIPTIDLNIEEFTHNLQTYMKNNMELEEVDMSRALVALTSEAASIPTPKLKNVSQLRTEHHVYELPDSHPLLAGMDKREPDDPCSYLLAIWTPGETAESIQPPGGQCSCQEPGTLCNVETCFLCNSIREANSQTVRGTLLIPCRTAMRGSFPLNGTYFQVNEVFADHDSSLNPIDVPRSWLWNLPRRTVYFGTSIPTIFRGLTTEGIQYCFWRGFVCVRGFDQKTRAPRPLMARLHFPASKLKRSGRRPIKSRH